MQIETLTPPDAARPRAPYSLATKANGFLFVAGIIALDPAGNLVGPGDIAAQTRRVLDLIQSAVELAGGRMNTILHNQIFLTDLADYDEMNKVYREYFPSYMPARYVVRADLVRAGALIEISSTAAVSAGGPA